jgi:hypothetical protein
MMKARTISTWGQGIKISCLLASTSLKHISLVRYG